MTPLQLGSDVEIAKRIEHQVNHDFGETPYCEGEFWRYAGTYWEAIPQDGMRCRVHACDGLPYGDGKRVRLNQGRISSILHELAAMRSEPGFFDERRTGINCISGFIEFDNEYMPRLAPHSPEHRQRHVLVGRWKPDKLDGLPSTSLLSKLLRGSFEGDADAAEKIALLGEIAGAAALGYGSQHIAPKAIVLLGRTAENGKSQILAVLRGLLPPGAVSAIPPSKFGDEKHVVRLAGKLLNTSDELGSAKAIASDGFKAIVTGEPVTGRDVFKTAVDFRSQAQHVFACNQLPTFHGGMDKGVVRRLLPILFNRTIPERERVQHIGQRVVEQELDLVLAWAVQGAARLLRRGYFMELPSSKAALTEWALSADPVLGWLEERVSIGLSVVGQDEPRVRTRRAHDDFKFWASSEGYAAATLPAMNVFSQRVSAAVAGRGVIYKHSGGFRGFVGMRLKPPVPGTSATQEADAA